MKFLCLLSATAVFSLSSCTTPVGEPQADGKNISVEASEPAASESTSAVYLPMP